MVEVHKGSIEVTSEEGRGTVFMIKLSRDPDKVSSIGPSPENQVQGFPS